MILELATYPFLQYWLKKEVVKRLYHDTTISFFDSIRFLNRGAQTHFSFVASVSDIMLSLWAHTFLIEGVFFSVIESPKHMWDAQRSPKAFCCDNIRGNNLILNSIIICIYPIVNFFNKSFKKTGPRRQLSWFVSHEMMWEFLVRNAFTVRVEAAKATVIWMFEPTLFENLWRTKEK